MSSILRIKSLKNEFTGSESKIADYIIENPEEVSQLTAEKLAANTSTSPASVVRFSKKIGYEGYQDLKIALAKSTIIHSNKNKIYEAVTTDDTSEEIIQKISAENIKIIEDTSRLLDKNALSEATTVILNAGKINIFGIGSSYLVGGDLQYKLLRINMPASIYQDPHLQLVTASNMARGDVAIGISHSGKSKETFDALKVAKESGAKIISITKYGSNPISDLADIRLYTAESERGFRMGAISSRIAQLTIIDMLFVNIVKENYEDIPQYILKSGSLVGNLKLDRI